MFSQSASFKFKQQEQLLLLLLFATLAMPGRLGAALLLQLASRPQVEMVARS